MRVGLFIPCYIEHLRPQAGLACARLFDRLGIDWRYPARQSCCGQPAFNAGYPAECLPAARHFLRVFEGYEAIVAPSGSCIAMLRRYARLPALSQAERGEMEQLGQRAFELSEFLVRRLGISDCGAEFAGRAVFQDCCHSLRELGLSDPPRRLLAAVRGLDLVDQPGLECCGFGGVFSVKLPELSVAEADARLDALLGAGTDTLIVTDVSCLIQLESRARWRGMAFRGLHLAELLAPEAVAAESAPHAGTGARP